MNDLEPCNYGGGKCTLGDGTLMRFKDECQVTDDALVLGSFRGLTITVRMAMKESYSKSLNVKG